jgi:hypothetical protein
MAWILMIAEIQRAEFVNRDTGAKLKSLVFLVLLLSTTTALAWETPRLPWGDPDLQGVWTTATITALERMAGFDELVVSEERVREIERQEAGFSAEIDDLPEGDLPSGEVVGGYNPPWIDAGTRLRRVNGEPRTSIVVEP